MSFLNQKVFLDVKDYGRIDQLEADICQLGGTIEKFLSKEVTCVVTNRTRTENALLHKDLSKPISTECQTLQPSAGLSRVMSRGQSILLRSNSLKDTPVCDPVVFAQTWGIKIVSLDTVVQAIDKHMQTCNASPSVSKQPTESHLVMKRRKFSSPVVKADREHHSKLFLTKFTGAFVKFEDTQSNFRPFFKQYSIFPHIDLESDLSNGIFKCAGNMQPVQVSKNVATAVITSKQVWSKHGYCECCDIMYDDLNQHLVSANHMRFAKHADHFADLDELIDEINFSADNSLLLPAEDSCTCHVASEMVFTECTNCRNPSTAAVESACHNVHSQENQLRDGQSKPEESDKVANAVENCEESQIVSVEQTDKCCRSPTHSTHTVNSDRNCDNDAVEKVSEVLYTQLLPYRCDVVNILPTVSQSVDSSKAAEAPCKHKLDDIMADEHSSHSGDDMPEFISSDCVTNLLELISSENSLHSPPAVEEARCHTVKASEKCSLVPPKKSAVLPCMPAAPNYDTADNEVLPNEKEHGQQMTVTTTTDKCHRFNAVVTVEQPFANVDISVIKNEPAATSADATKLLEASLVTTYDRNYCDITSCNVKSETVSSALPLFEVSNDLVLPPVDQPDTCATTVTNNSAVPVYACCQVNSSHLFDDRAFSPAISSGLMAYTFDLHDKLLSMAYEHDAKQQGSSSVLAPYLCSADCADVPTSEMSDIYSQMECSPTLCLSEDLSPLADSADAYPCSPIDSSVDSFEKLATSVTENIAVKFMPMCHSLPICGDGICSVTGSTDVNGNIQCSVPYVGFKTNAEVSVVREGNVGMCLGQEKGDSCLRNTFENEVKSDSQSATADKAHLEVRLMDTCCRANVLDLAVSTCSALPFQAEPNNETSVLKFEPSDTSVLKEDEEDVDNDSASTVVYSLDCTTEHINDNKSDTTVEYTESTVPSANSIWKVVSVDECRMRLVRTQAQSARNVNKVSSKSCVLQPESHNATESVGQTAMDSDSVSVLVYNSTCPTASVNGRMREKSDVIGEPSISSTDFTWEVISFVDSRMRLVRS